MTPACIIGERARKFAGKFSRPLQFLPDNRHPCASRDLLPFGVSRPLQFLPDNRHPCVSRDLLPFGISRPLQFAPPDKCHSCKSRNRCFESPLEQLKLNSKCNSKAIYERKVEFISHPSFRISPSPSTSPSTWLIVNGYSSSSPLSRG